MKREKKNYFQNKTLLLKKFILDIYESEKNK
jgi:hypothetical protein